MNKRKLITLLLLFFMPFSSILAQEVMSLAGEWGYKVDEKNEGLKNSYFNQKFTQKATLPASSDQIGIGKAEIIRDSLNGLQRRHSYVGKVWYQKEVEIPSSWQGKNITLLLERCHWVTEVWVDNTYSGRGESLSAPHTFNLSEYLTPGKHTITVCVDNKLLYQMGGFASSVSNHTQTNWNGMVGRLELRQTDPLYIDQIRTFPNISQKSVKVEVSITNKTPKTYFGNGAITISLDNKKITTKEFKFESSLPTATAIVEVEMGENPELWSEFNPKLYTATVSIKGDKFTCTDSTAFGMREVGVKDKMFTLNGKKIYLRGNLECCIFPLTGYPPMDVAGWERVLTIMKRNGLNHIRFHSWCPPAAAFEAADKLGFYLQPEGPRANVGIELIGRNKFVADEMMRICKTYGNHPSFLMTTTGNELKAVSEVNDIIIKKSREYDNRHLYSKTSGGYGMHHKSDLSESDDYKIGGARGWYNISTYTDHSKTVASSPFPLISHEVGQWCVYPAINDVEKYAKGVLNPINLITLKQHLENRGLLNQFNDFFYVSGMFAATLYKEEVEVLLRTKDHAGFQLLQMQDYPGQGTANVGLYDAFWNNKGFITPEKFSRFCNATVPLLRMNKRTYLSSETFEAQIDIFHYGLNDIASTTPKWVIRNQNGKVVASGELKTQKINQGSRKILGKISLPLDFVKKAEKYNIEVTLSNTTAANDWDVWFYPATPTPIKGDKVKFTKDFSQAIALLQKGETVLFNPEKESIKGVIKGEFKPSFWSPVWFFTKNRGGNRPMSILVDVEHKALEYFPTEKYSNWQWYDPIQYSNVMVINALSSSLKPIVQVVDNYERNYRLANLFEAKVGKGKLLVCSINLDKAAQEKAPAIKQLKYSLDNYLNSSKFKPSQTVTTQELNEIFKETSK